MWMQAALSNPRLKILHLGTSHTSIDLIYDIASFIAASRTLRSLSICVNVSGKMEIGMNVNVQQDMQMLLQTAMLHNTNLTHFSLGKGATPLDSFGSFTTTRVIQMALKRNRALHVADVVAKDTAADLDGEHVVFEAGDTIELP
jgi:hypothetical protein